MQVHLGDSTHEIVEAFARRSAEGDRHPGHGDTPEDADEVRAELEAGRWEPLDLPGELIRASSDADEHELAARVPDSIGHLST